MTTTVPERPTAAVSGPPAAVRIEAVTFQIGRERLFSDFSLTIPVGSYFVLLGPSGAGKTTLLRLIAGFRQVAGGRIHVNGHDVTTLPPGNRGTATVFQDGALFPHMSVWENVAFSDRVKGLSKAKRRQIAKTLLQQVQLAERFMDRPVNELSGGERQRVALARALASKPEILLLDEPLASLDPVMQRVLRDVLRTAHRDSQKTFVEVTHSQEHALACADYIAVIDKGRLEQIGTPRDVYDSPQSEFVATFVGGANVVHGIVERTDGQLRFVSSLFTAILASNPSLDTGAAIAILRPERLELCGANDLRPTKLSLRGIILDSRYVGNALDVDVQLAARTVWRVRTTETSVASVGAEVMLVWSPEHVVFLSATPR